MKFCFTVDDNIKFFQQLNDKPVDDIFSHGYLKGWKKLHDKYGLKVQFNVFYKYVDGSFDLSKMTDRYKSQFDKNSDWLKFSFHSEKENVKPYEASDYNQVYGDISKVNAELERIVGKSALADTTTIHYCLLTDGGKRAVKENGVKGLLGLFGNEEAKRTSYGIGYENAERIRKGEIIDIDGIKYAGIDVILNLYSAEEIKSKLKGIIGRDYIKIMTHEQYYYKDYFNYQPDYFYKNEQAVKMLIESGYESSFYQDF